MADGWYYAQGGHQLGPVGLEQLRAMLRAGQVRADELIWTEGLSDWLPARDVAVLHQQPSPPPSVDVAPAPPPTGFAQAIDRPAPVSMAYSPIPYDARPQSTAITSLVFGVGSFALCVMPYVNLLAWIGAVCAIVFGFIARGKVARGEEQGGGLALAGIILGFAHLVLLLLVIVAIVIFGVAIAGAAARGGGGTHLGR